MDDLQFHHVGRLRSAGAFGDFEFDPLTFFQGSEPPAQDGGIMDEHVIAVLHGDETVAFLRVEPFHNTLQMENLPKIFSDLRLMR